MQAGLSGLGRAFDGSGQAAPLAAAFFFVAKGGNEVARRKQDGGREKLTLVSAAKPQLTKPTERDWSKAKAARFLAVLAETCNVSEACRQSEVSVTTAYRRKRVDAGFRAEWIDAIATAYQRLELMLLERAFIGTEKVVRRKDGSEERMMEYPNQLGLTLLKMHRDTAIEASTEFEPDQIEELKAKLMSKLRRLKGRDDAAEPEPA